MRMSWKWWNLSISNLRITHNSWTFTSFIIASLILSNIEINFLCADKRKPSYPILCGQCCEANFHVAVLRCSKFSSRQPCINKFWIGKYADQSRYWTEYPLFQLWSCPKGLGFYKRLSATRWKLYVSRYIEADTPIANEIALQTATRILSFPDNVNIN